MKYVMPAGEYMSEVMSGREDEEIVHRYLAKQKAPSGKYHWFVDITGVIIEGRTAVDIAIERFEKAGITTWASESTSGTKKAE